MLKRPPSIGGWCLVNTLDDEQAIKTWETRWITIENGYLLCCHDEVKLPGSVSAIRGRMTATNHTLESGEAVVSMIVETVDEGNVKIELALHQDELVVWKSVVDLNARMLQTKASLRDIKTAIQRFYVSEGKREQSLAVAVKIKEGTFNSSVGPVENVSNAARRIIEQHRLKADVAPRIEVELLKAREGLLLSRETMLMKSVASLNRKLADYNAVEKRAIEAEAHSARLSASVERLEVAVLQLDEKLQQSARQLTDKDDKISSLISWLEDEQRGHKELRDKLEEIGLGDNDILKPLSQLALSREVRSLRKDKASLTSQLREANAQLRRSRLHAAAMASPKVNKSAHRKGEVPLPDDILNASNDEVDADTQHLQERVAGLKDTVRAHRHLLSITETDCTNLRRKCEDLQSSLTAAIEGRRRCEETLEKTRAQLRQAMHLSHGLTTDEIAAENRYLREQVVALRGDLLRLQSQFDNGEEMLPPSSNAAQQDSYRASAFSAARRNQQHFNDGAGGDGDGDRSPGDRMEELSDLEADPDEPGPRTLQPFQQQSQANPTAAPADQTLQGRIQNWQYKVDRVVLDDDRVLWNNGGAGTGRDVYNNRPSNVPMLSKDNFPFAPALPNANASMISLPIQRKQQQIVDLSAGPISEQVEQRLLQDIFSHYAQETFGHLTLTRYWRFAKDFGIIADASEGFYSTGAGNTRLSQLISPPHITSGEVDIIFSNAVKMAPSSSSGGAGSSKGRSNPSPTRRGSPLKTSSREAPKDLIFKVKDHAAIAAAAAAKKGKMTVEQFAASLGYIAVKLYDNVIVRQTGTVFECLPPEERDAAMRAALEVMMKKKVFPIAAALGLFPWVFYYMDNALVSMQVHSIAYQAISQNARQLVQWFVDYSTAYKESAAGDNVKTSAVNVKQQQESNLEEDDEYAPVDGKMIFRAMSAFAHDFGIVPYIMKEHHLYSIFNQIIDWGSSHTEFTSVLPPEYHEMVESARRDEGFMFPPAPPNCSSPDKMVTEGEKNGSKSDKQQQKNAGFIDVKQFAVVVATIAIQCFPNVMAEERIQEIFRWIDKSGGSYLTAGVCSTQRN